MCWAWQGCALRTSIAHSALSNQNTSYCRFPTGWVSAPGCASATTYQRCHLRWSEILFFGQSQDFFASFRISPIFCDITLVHFSPPNSNVSFFPESHCKVASTTSKKWDWACKDAHSFVKIVSLVQTHRWFVTGMPDSDSGFNIICMIQTLGSKLFRCWHLPHRKTSRKDLSYPHISSRFSNLHFSAPFIGLNSQSHTSRIRHSNSVQGTPSVNHLNVMIPVKQSTQHTHQKGGTQNGTRTPPEDGS